MPATVSSRSVGPDPPIRITAGSGVVTPGGLVMVAAMLNPMLGIITLSSPGIENAAVRAAADAMSSRAISIICVGMLRRSSPPSGSAHRFINISPAGGGLLRVSE